MKALLKILLTITFLVMATAITMAQPDFPSDPSQAPIDGGLGILAAAGGTYALKKLRDRKKQQEAADQE